MREASLKVAGMELPLMQSPRGPLIADFNHPEIEPLAWLINLAVDGKLQNLREDVEAGRDIDYNGLSAVREVSGEYRISGDFFPTVMLFPAQSIIETLVQLRTLRESFQRELPRSVVSKDVGIAPPPDLPSVDTAQTGSPRSFGELEARAAELDRLVRRERTLEHAAEESAKRRFLLLDLAASDLFDSGRDLDIAATLPTLRAYRQAGLGIARYLASETRRRFNPHAVAAPVVGAPVSIDWFRFPSPAPAHLTAEEWLAFLENMLAGTSAQGGEGEIFVRVGAGWWTLCWRCDDAIHPAVVAVKAPA